MKISAFALALVPTAAPYVAAFGPALPRSAIHIQTIRSSALFAKGSEESSSSTSTSTPNKRSSHPLIMVDEESGEDAIVEPSVTRDAPFEILDLDGLSSSSSSSSGSRTILPLGVRLTGAEKLRSDGLTGKGVRVAVIDSGVDANHPGFHDMVKQQLWYRHGRPLSQDDHGTHVAGTIHMMAPEAEIYDYRVFGAEGWRVDRAVAESIMQAVEDGCDVINMSLGGPRASWRIGNAVKFAYSQGVPMIVAAGNEGDNNPLTNERSYPAMRPEVVSIAAVSKRENLPVARFSNGNAQVDYSGIGVNVHSFMPGGGFKQMSGTSMATPHVCGLVAALLTKSGQYNDGINNDEGLRKLLSKFAVDIGVTGPDNATGLGFLTYLNEREHKELWDETPFMERQMFRP